VFGQAGPAGSSAGHARCAGAFSSPTRAPRGGLLAATSDSDVVDALLALLAVPGDQLLTGDPDDLESSRRGARNTHDGDPDLIG
jgi:hypothetical protein